MKGWYSRGYLPHFDGGEIAQAVTFRLAGSLPMEAIEQMEDELALLPKDQAWAERRRRIDAYLDSGHGELWLADPRIAELVENALLHFDGERYRLHGWVIMPNHVHVLVTPMAGHSLASIMHSWKSYAASEANHILDRSMAFWQRDYFDRAIRDERLSSRRCLILRTIPSGQDCARVRRNGATLARDALSKRDGHRSNWERRHGCRRSQGATALW